jgi:hypothetical protein
MDKCLNPPEADKTPEFLNDSASSGVQKEDRVYDLQWIDGFVRKIKSYVYVR